MGINYYCCCSDGKGFHDLMADIQGQAELSSEMLRAITAEPVDFGMGYDEVSWIFLCLQCLLYLEMAIYLLSKPIESWANLMYSTVVIITN